MCIVKIINHCGKYMLLVIVATVLPVGCLRESGRDADYGTLLDDQVALAMSNTGGSYSYPSVVIKWLAANQQDVDSYTELLLNEVGKYDGLFVRKIGLGRIVLCSRLTVNGERRGGVPCIVNSTLYIDVDSVSRNIYDSNYRSAIKTLFHHELFHMFDYNDDGSHADLEWEVLGFPRSDGPYVSDAAQLEHYLLVRFQATCCVIGSDGSQP